MSLCVIAFLSSIVHLAENMMYVYSSFEEFYCYWLIITKQFCMRLCVKVMLVFVQM